MEPKNKQMLQKNRNEDSLFDVDTVASSMECTGLIPTPPASDAEAESYTELYTIPKPENEHDNGLQSLKKTKRTPGIVK